MKYLFLTLLLGLSILSSCQSNKDKLEELAEIYIEEMEDAGDFMAVYEWMSNLYEHKVNLNKASHAELMKVPYMNSRLVTEIVEHKKQFGDFIAVYELQVLPSFTKELIFKVIPFIQIMDKKVPLKKVLKHSEHKLYLRYIDQLEKPRGYKNNYLGTLGKAYMRYQITSLKKMSLGFVAENDAYEPLLVKEQWIDYFSFHCQLKDMGVVKNLVFGDYQANFGQGLILGAGFGGFKSYEATNLGSSFQGVNKYSSVDENLFLRGVASTFLRKNIEFTPFVSYNKIDASIKQSNDSTENEEYYFTNTQSSGLHRTLNEINNKDELIKKDYGFNANYEFGKLNFGLTYLKTLYSKTKEKEEKLYKALDLTGKEFSNFSINYNLINRNIYLSGELAVQNGKKIALLNKLLVSLSSGSEALIVYRNYASGYFSPSAKAFGEKSQVSNEKGIYFGIKTRLSNEWSVSMYGDYYSFPWLRFGVYSPSNGKDFVFKINRTYTKLDNYYLRFKMESYGVQKKNSKSSSYDPTFFQRDTYIKETINAKQLKGRIHFNYQIHNNISAATRMEFCAYEEKANELISKGIMFYQDLRYFIHRKWKLGLRGIVFNTDDYNSRIYSFEQNVLYSYSIPAYHGKGVRCYCLLQFKPSYVLNLQLKIGRTSYTMQDEIGAGDDLIKSSRKTTFTLQGRIKW